LALVAACVVPMVGRFWLYRIHPTLHLNFSPLVRLPEFVAGIGVAFLHARGAKLGGWALAAFAAAVMVAVCAPGEGLWRLVVLHIGFLGMILSLAGLRRFPTGFPWRSMVLLGQASFAIFLLHAPLAELVLGRLGNGPFAWPAYAAIVVVASIAALEWIEIPARRWILARAATGR
jgi:peptidoglycan/LPS O-acetylase OafA/YrhL